MSPALYSEDTLVQQTTAEYLEERLGWQSVYAYNAETFGPDGTLGRTGEEEVVLTRYLRAALDSLNPGLPEEAVDNAVRAIVAVSAAQSTLQTNQEKYDLLRNGVKVTYRDPCGAMETRTLRVFDFDVPENNHFLAVRELWIKGPLYRRRADLIGFVNGIPLLFMELKNIHRNVRRAYDENLTDYKDTIPHLFHHNARSWCSATAWTPASAASRRRSRTSASGSAWTRTNPVSSTWRRCSRRAPTRTLDHRGRSACPSAPFRPLRPPVQADNITHGRLPTHHVVAGRRRYLEQAARRARFYP